MKTFVIIPQFLVTDELVKLASDCIDSWRKHNVYVISVDDTGEYSKAKGADEVMAKSDVVVKMLKNSGFGPACNAGFKVAMKETEDCYIVCCNNDTLVYENTLQELIRPFNEYENVAITGICSTTEKELEGKTLDKYSYPKISEGGFLNDRMQDGGLWCSTKKVLEKIGLFDEQFLRGGYEDVDLFLRAKDTFGMKIIMNGHGWYWHKQGATRWNSEQIGAINDFGQESKNIENDNLKKFIVKWGFDPHHTSIWKETLL
jgi:GT2 family glycosyltransferase